MLSRAQVDFETPQCFELLYSFSKAQLPATGLTSLAYFFHSPPLGSCKNLEFAYCVVFLLNPSKFFLHLFEPVLNFFIKETKNPRVTFNFLHIIWWLNWNFPRFLFLLCSFIDIFQLVEKASLLVQTFTSRSVTLGSRVF